MIRVFEQGDMERSDKLFLFFVLFFFVITVICFFVSCLFWYDGVVFIFCLCFFWSLFMIYLFMYPFYFLSLWLCISVEWGLNEVFGFIILLTVYFLCEYSTELCYVTFFGFLEVFLIFRFRSWIFLGSCPSYEAMVVEYCYLVVYGRNAFVFIVLWKNSFFMWLQFMNYLIEVEVMFVDYIQVSICFVVFIFFYYFFFFWI